MWLFINRTVPEKWHPNPGVCSTAHNVESSDEEQIVFSVRKKGIMSALMAFLSGTFYICLLNMAL